MIDALGSILAALVVFVALPLTWYVAFRLWRLSRQSPELKVLRERAIAMLALALIVTVFSIVFVNNEIGIPPLDVPTTRIMTRGALLLLSVVPSLYWLRIYRDDRT